MPLACAARKAAKPQPGLKDTTLASLVAPEAKSATISLAARFLSTLFVLDILPLRRHLC